MIKYIATITFILQAAQALAVDISLTNPDGSSVHFDVEIADTPKKRKKGLMFREYLPEYKGMLFLMEKSRPVSMWMKNTPISLDMIFFNERGIVHHIIEKARPFSTRQMTPIEHTYTVLEVPAGSCEKYGIREGTTLDYRPIAPA